MSSVTRLRAAIRRRLLGIVVVVLVLGACGSSAANSIDADLDQSLDEVVAEMRAWSEDQPEWTWTDGVPDNYVGGLAYSFCLLLEEESVERVREILIEQADDDPILEREWIYMLGISRLKVC